MVDAVAAVAAKSVVAVTPIITVRRRKLWQQRRQLHMYRWRIEGCSGSGHSSAVGKAAAMEEAVSRVRMSVVDGGGGSDAIDVGGDCDCVSEGGNIVLDCGVGLVVYG